MLSLSFIIGISYFIFGAIVGSFLNVLILRYNTNKTLGGRSACMSCGRALTAVDLVPVISWVMLRGRCRSCTSRIPWQYPLVEASLGLLFLFVYWSGVGITETIAALFLSTLFLFIVVYDLKHLIIPVWPMRVVTLVAFTSLFVDASSLSLLLPNLWDALMGPALFAFFAILFFATKGRGVGFGDAKLSLAIGWLLGFPDALHAFMLAFWIGAVVGLLMLFVSKRAARKKDRYLAVSEDSVLVRDSEVGKWSAVIVLRRVYLRSMETPLWHGKTEVPFAPFLALGLAITYFFNSELLALARFLNVALY